MSSQHPTLECPHCGTRQQDEMAFCPVDGTPLQQVRDPFIGQTIAGRYVVEELIGSGAMGTVYRARHNVIERNVAIKFLHPKDTDDSHLRERLLREARAANQIDHENIIDITDFGETRDGLVYLVMEYLRGRPLAVEIAKGPMPPSRVIEITLQIAAGLARAHELGVVHRDVKPDNVFLLRRGGEEDFVKLLDFGIARSKGDSSITKRGAVIGTPEYMAPELLEKATATRSSDLYSLGCVMFEMLTGKEPFCGGQAQVMMAQVTKPPPAPSDERPDLPKGFDAVVLKLLSKAPRHRHQDAYHLIDDLMRLRGSLPPMPERGNSAHPPRMPTDRPAEDRARPEALWLERVEGWRERLSRADDIPNRAKVVETVDRIEAQARRAMTIRASLAEIGQSATEHQDGARENRLQIFKALDGLAHDHSQVMRTLEEDEEALADAKKHRERALAQVATQRVELRPLPAPGDAVSAGFVDHLQMLLDATDALTMAYETSLKLGKRTLTYKQRRDDLEFQIEQLKGRLGSVNATTNIDIDQVNARAGELEAELDGALDKILALGWRVTSVLDKDPSKTVTRPGA